MAKKMGCENFVELGYYRMERISFGTTEVEIFRQNVWRPLSR